MAMGDYVKHGEPVSSPAMRIPAPHSVEDNAFNGMESRNNETDLSFTIDRVLLRRYLLVQSRLGCLACMLPTSLVVGLAFAKIAIEARPHGHWTHAILCIVGSFSLATIAGVVSAEVLHRMYFAPSANRLAKNLKVTMGSDVVRIVSGGFLVQDRLIPKEEICGCRMADGPVLRRFGLKQVHIQLRHRGQPLEGFVGLSDPEAFCQRLLWVTTSRSDRMGR